MGGEGTTCARCGRELASERVVKGQCLRCRTLAIVDGLEAALAGHARRVTHLAMLAADELGVEADVHLQVEIGGLLHDVGKLAIPARILSKAGPLDDDETAVMRTHVTVGERLARDVEGCPSGVAMVVRHSHERWDGNGYPDGLAGEEIPLAARIISGADALDAMTSFRSYRAPLPLDFALEVLRVEAGRQFDAEVVAALRIVAEQWSVELAAEPMATAFEETLRRLRRVQRGEARAGI